jgi:hypothetical protein
VQNFSLGRIMALSSYPRLVSTLQPPKQRAVALALVAHLAESGTRVIDEAHVSMLLRFVQPLVLASSAEGDAVRRIPWPSQCFVH